LTLFFSSIDGDEDIFTATRVGRGTAFSSATPLPNLDVGGSVEGTPFPSFDGLSLYFFSTRAVPDAVGDRDIWLATRPNGSAEFADPFVLPAVNAVAIDHLPWLSQDELTLMLVSGRPSPNGNSNIWVSERASRADNFGEPVEVAGVNTDAREEGFTLSNDGLTLIFASNRVTEALMDLWVATRPDLSSPFGPAENLAQLNTPENELDVSLSADGFELFFASSRNGAFQLFRSVRDCSAGSVAP